MSILGSILGIIRLLRLFGVFELLKPELRRFSRKPLNAVKRSFCRPKHWITMGRETINLDRSAQQLKVAHCVGNLPIISIKASSFFKLSFWTRFIPLRHANRLRDEMHAELRTLSPGYLEIDAHDSGHFVWIDQPDLIADAVKIMLQKYRQSLPGYHGHPGKVY